MATSGKTEGESKKPGPEIRTALIAGFASVVSALCTIGVAYMGGLFQVANTRTANEGTVLLEKLKFGNEVVKDALAKDNPANSLLFYADIGLLENSGLKADAIKGYAEKEKQRVETGSGGESLLPSFDKAGRPSLWLDRDFLSTFAPRADAKFVDALVSIGNYLLLGFAIDRSPARLSMFLGVFAHESGGFKLAEERADYSRTTLLRIWPRFFTEANADQYANQPEKILNLVYANRMGNGPEASGDGWRYRGRGILQITGRTNYERFSTETGIDLVNNADLASDPNVSLLIATAYWYNSKLNDLADRGDLEGILKKIDGGASGLDDVRAYSDAALKLLSQSKGQGG